MLYRRPYAQFVKPPGIGADKNVNNRIAKTE
jgi:hypothetical protein